MSEVMDEEIKRWTARRKSALVLDIIQGKTTVSESSRQFDLPPSEIESWIDQAKSGMENPLKAKPEHRLDYVKMLDAASSATCSPIANEPVRPGDSKPKRLISPAMP